MNKLAQMLCVTGLTAMSFLAAEGKAKSYEGELRCVAEKSVGAKLSLDRKPVNFHSKGKEYRVLNRENVLNLIEASGEGDYASLLRVADLYVRSVDKNPGDPTVWTPLSYQGNGFYRTSGEYLNY